MNRQNILMVADSEHDANMLYAVGFFMPDPFIYLGVKGVSYLVSSDLELDRARKLSRHCQVLSLSRFQHKLRKQGMKEPQLAHVIQFIIRQHRLKKLFVPASFSYGLAQELRRLKIKLKVRQGPFFPERECKTADEVKKISASLIMAEVGLSEALLVLKSSIIGKNGRLYYRNNPLTADKLRSVINVAIFQAGGIASHTIVAGGRQGSNPHEEGNGVLKAHQPIIIDIFPRSQKTGYFGDITRTVVRGRSSEAVRKMYQTVARAQALAFSMMRHLTPGAEVHRAVQEFFVQQGYPTGRHNGRLQGFFHGTGHGLGLELHEAPRVGPNSSDVLKADQVVTVEPGLYLPEIGGVRLEDVALITRQAPSNLTKFEKVLEI